MEKARHTISRGLVFSLEKFALTSQKIKKENLHLIKDVGFNNYEYNNFQKLRYFGLVGKGDEIGEWFITTKGKWFLNGSHAIEKSVTTFRNVVLEKSTDIINIKDIVKDRTSDYWQKQFSYQTQTSKLF